MLQSWRMITVIFGKIGYLFHKKRNKIFQNSEIA